MAEEAKFGTFADLIEIAPGHIQPIMWRLREIVLEIYPDSCEVVRLGDRAATYGIGPRKMSEGVVYIMPQNTWANLGFYKGADLPDPGGVLEGTGSKLRHIKVRSLEDAEQPALRELIRAAVVERKQALGK